MVSTFDFEKWRLRTELKNKIKINQLQIIRNLLIMNKNQREFL